MILPQNQPNQLLPQNNQSTTSLQQLNISLAASMNKIFSTLLIKLPLFSQVTKNPLIYLSTPISTLAKLMADYIKWETVNTLERWKPALDYGPCEKDHKLIT